MFRLEKQEQFTIGVLVLLVAAVIVGITVGRRPREPGVPVDLGMNMGPADSVRNDEEAGSGAAKVVVHVTGQVEEPGTYELPRGARVDDAVQRAKPTSGADLDALNLAARVFDGQKIVVPAYENTPRVMPREREDDAAGNGDNPIDLNSATQAELETLSGIGPSRAKSILEYRQNTGSGASRT